MKKGWTVLALTVVLSGLSACGANNNAADNRNDTGLQTRNVRVNNVNNVNRINSTGVTVSTRASRNVERLAEVDRAHVIISNNNAYVAVRLANNGTNNTNNIPGTGAGITGTGNRSSINGTSGTGVSGSGTTNGTAGTGNGMTTNGIGANGIGSTGVGTPNISGTNSNIGTVPPSTNSGTNNLGYNNTGRTTTFNRDDVNRAGVLDTNRNNTTINGTNGTNYSKVDTALEKRIANQVRATNKNIDKVYVSVNSDFYNRMNSYSNDIRNGNNRDGVLRDFNNTVRGMFNR